MLHEFEAETWLGANKIPSKYPCSNVFMATYLFYGGLRGGTRERDVWKWQTYIFNRKQLTCGAEVINQKLESHKRSLAEFVPIQKSFCKVAEISTGKTA